MDRVELERMAQAWADHGRQFGQYQFVYPVISRRAGGISLGINLNPDLHCNFDCPYCQVDRTVPPESLPTLTLDGLRTELQNAVAHWMHNRFTDSTRFQGIPHDQLDLKDFCLSGDGEPTMATAFPEVCGLMQEIQQALGAQTPLKLVLITNATLLHQERVRNGLQLLTSQQGEIWGKLDAGSEAHFQSMSRSRFTLDHIEKNLTLTVRDFPLRIQTMLCAVNGMAPSQKELDLYLERVRRIQSANPKNLLEVQLYTIIRRTATENVTPLPAEYLQDTAKWIQSESKVFTNAY